MLSMDVWLRLPQNKQSSIMHSSESCSKNWKPDYEVQAVK